MFRSLRVMSLAIGLGACAPEGTVVLLEADDSSELARLGDTWYLAWVEYCPSASCGSQIRPLNQAEMYCPYAGIDSWSCQGFSSFVHQPAGLTAAEEVEAEAAKDEGRLLVRGHIRTTPDPYTQSGVRHEVIVSQAWVGGTGTDPVGAFVSEKDTGSICIDEPCPYLDEKVLNRARRSVVSELDFTPSGATADQEVEARAAGASPEGVIIAGERYQVIGVGGSGVARTVTEYYTKLHP